jgi:hypothetical protein
VRHDDQGDDEGLLTEQDAASCSGVAVNASQGPGDTGPPSLEIGRQVWYRRTALKRWLSRRTKVGSPDETASGVSFSAVLV